MRHILSISVSKEPINSGVVAFHTVSVREKLLRFLLGHKCKLTVIVPGDSVDELCIKEVAESGVSA